MREDTARLALHLARMRGGEFTAVEFRPIQTEYLEWIDSRVRARSTLAQINGELQEAKLLFKEPETFQDDFDRNNAGYLSPVQVEPVRQADDLLALKLGIYTGGGCDYDETVVLYQRKPFRRLGWLNAEQSYQHGHYLHEVGVGKDNAAHTRVIASAWFASNCTSAWNGTRLRIDLLQSQIITNVLNREALARNDVEVAVSIKDDVATFRYSTDMHDTVIQSREGVASYLIQDGHAIRQGPIASQFGGFIDEWLLLDDDDASRVSSPAAARAHHAAAERFKNDLFEWEHVADCPDATREIAVRGEKSGQNTVFLLSSSSIVDMQMLLVSDKLNPSCREIDISKDLTAITTGPPQ